jgi:hypothetical protein
MTAAAPFLSDHTAHLIGATIILGALLWMAADVALFIAGLVVERHVQRALGDGIPDHIADLDCYSAVAAFAAPEPSGRGRDLPAGERMTATLPESAAIEAEWTRALRIGLERHGRTPIFDALTAEMGRDTEPTAACFHCRRGMHDACNSGETPCRCCTGRES